MSATPDTGFASSPTRRIAGIYVSVTAGALAILFVVLRLGRGKEAPLRGGAAEAEGHGSPIDTHEVFWKLLLAIVVVIAAARFLGAVFRRIGQPQVVGEIVAGVLLGPTLLGTVWPGAAEFVFNEDVLPFVDVFSQIGLVFFMFLVGVELDVRLIRGQGAAAALVSHTSIVVPFISGVLLALVIFSTLRSPDGDFLPFALFLGASMSVTAFPVLARILTERRLHKTRLGAVTITCAAVDDVTAWCILAVVVTVARADGATSALITVGLSVAFIVAMIVFVRPLLGRLASHHADRGRLSSSVMAALFVGLLLSALATDRIGIHAIFGAFLFGAIMPQRSELTEELFEKLEDFSVIFLLPLFFAYSGLRTDLLALGADPQLWMYTALVVLVAVVGKWGGSSLAARAVGMPWRDSLSLGILMNCRGLTELVILNIGLDLGVIPPTLFSMLVIMALVTTFMTTPILAALRPSTGDVELTGAPEASTGADVVTVMVHVASMANAYELVHTALASVASDDENIEIVLLRTIELPTDRLVGGAMIDGRDVDRARRSLQPLAQFVEGAGATAVTLVIQTTDTARTVIDVASARSVDTVVLSSRRPFAPESLRRGTLGRILDEVTCNVMVLVDPTGRGTSPPPRGQIIVPFVRPAEHAVRVARQIAMTHGAVVRLVSTIADQGEAARLAARHADQSGVLARSEVMEEETIEALLSTGEGADLVVLPLNGGAESTVVGGGRAWSTTPVLVLRDAATPPVDDPAAVDVEDEAVPEVVS